MGSAALLGGRIVTALIMVALASERAVSPEVAVAWAPLAIDERRWGLAYELARAAMEDPTSRFAGWQTYLTVSEATGLADVAEAELMASADPLAPVVLAWWLASRGLTPPGTLDGDTRPEAAVARATMALQAGRFDLILAQPNTGADPSLEAARLRALVAAGDRRGLHQEALDWLDRAPLHPEPLSELWGAGAPDVGARRKVVAALVSSSSTDPAWLLRAATTLRAAGADDEAATLIARLPADLVGADAPLPRGPWGAPMIRAMAKALSNHGAPSLPPASPAESVALAAELSQALLLRDRAADALAMWREAEARDGGSWQVALGMGEALRAVGDVEGAEQALRHAMTLTVAPWDADPCGLDLVERAQAADAVARAAYQEARPSLRPAELSAAIQGDPMPWSRSTDDAALAGCLAYAAGASSGRAWRGVHAPAAARVMPALWAAAVDAAPREMTPEPLQRPPAPNDAFPLVEVQLDSGSTPMQALLGAPTVVSLWASWCAPCRKELPALDRAMATLRADGVVFRAVALSIDDDPRPYRHAADRMELKTWEIGRDPSALAALRVDGLPVTWLLDPEGRVLSVHVGYDAALPDTLSTAIRAAGAR